MWALSARRSPILTWACTAYRPSVASALSARFLLGPALLTHGSLPLVLGKIGAGFCICICICYLLR